MASKSESTQIAEKPRSRQRQGPACAECRRRKLRCDGEQPNCGTCSDLGIECEQTTFTSLRGPKKGYMKALQSRMASLEARLQEQISSGGGPASSHGSDVSEMHLQCDLPPAQFDSRLSTPPLPNTIGGPSFMPQDFIMDMSMDMNMNMDTCMDTNMLPTFDFGIDPEISELVQADLDQIYFERAHSFAPILQRRRYFAWANQPSKTEAQRGLQYAIWTLASTFSTQSEYLRLMLRTAAVRILDDLESKEVEPELIEIEHAQARVILLIHDFLKSSFELGWLGAAKCFRLLQYMRLYDIDGPQQVGKRSAAAQAEDKVLTEEMRRTFWVAYSIDCFISLRSARLPSFQETSIAVRLLVPEEQFQCGRCTRQSLLSEVMTSFTDQSFCPFSESVIIATICSRAVQHGQQAAAENSYSRATSQLWTRHFWIEELLKARSHVLGLDNPRNVMEADSLLIFAKIASSSIMLYLCQVLESKTWITPEDQEAVLKVKERTAQAAQEVGVLLESLSHLSRFKIHPFTPLLLGFCADFLKDRHDDFGLNDINIQQIVQLLAEMSSVNKLADDAWANTGADTSSARSSISLSR